MDWTAFALSLQLAGWTVVAHNAQFEKGFLPNLLGPIRAPVLDSCEVLHYLHPELSSHSLEAMLRWAGLGPRARHRAMTDCEATHGVLVLSSKIEKLVSINDYALELPIEKHHIVMLYTDRPGIVAIYGQKFGEASINIAGMQIARKSAGGQALSILTLDSPVSDELLDDVQSAIQADLFRQIEITES